MNNIFTRLETQTSFDNKIHFVSLGCPRNLTDTEVMLGIVLQAGYEITDKAAEADFLVLNTCSFLKIARDEAISHLKELLAEKKATAKLILTGCMLSKHKEQLEPWISQIHYLLGPGNVADILKALQSKSPGQILSARSFLNMGEIPRKISTPGHYAYLKIAEGCRKRCAFCIIPQIKGPLQSKPLNEIIREFKALLKQNMKEIILIAQDLGDYGKDFSENKQTSHLPELLKTLSEIPGDHVIRLLYLYPDEITDELISVIKAYPRILPYLDIPFQHINNRILQTMKRKTSSEEIYCTLTKLRSEIPDIHIRSSFIIGFPGETDEEFEELVSFIKSSHLDHVGFFLYSQEDGTPAALLPNQIDDKTKEKRLKIISKIQEKIVSGKNSRLIGKRIPVIVDGYHEDSSLLFKGRYFGQAPDIDGCVIINDGNCVRKFGERYITEITGILGFDLIGKILEPVN